MNNLESNIKLLDEKFKMTTSKNTHCYQYDFFYQLCDPDESTINVFLDI